MFQSKKVNNKISIENQLKFLYKSKVYINNKTLKDIKEKFIHSSKKLASQGKY